MVRRRAAVLISGRGSNMLSLLRAARSPVFPADIVLVLSNRAQAVGLASARENGVRTTVVEHRRYGGDRTAHEAAVAAELDAAGVELVCLAGYLRLLTPWFVARFAGNMLNIHPSLLPAFPGLDTHARALAAGVKLHGCTVHLVSDDMDQGRILAQAAVPVIPGDDVERLAARVLVQEHRIYPPALAALAGKGSETRSPDPATALANPAIGEGLPGSHQPS